MISFQTEADVGRTRISRDSVTPQSVWRQISTAVGCGLPRDNLRVGHPDCSNMTTLLISYPERRAINLIGADDESREFWAHILSTFGGIGSRGVRAGGDVVKKRLAACAFMGAVKKNGAWQAVSMCEMNANERETLYRATLDVPTAPPGRAKRSRAALGEQPGYCASRGSRR